MIQADTLCANVVGDIKKPGGTCRHPCLVCSTSHENLGKGNANIVGDGRTSTGVEDGLRKIRAATTLKEEDSLSRELGIVVRGTWRNPFRWEVSTDTVNDVPVDTFHQDSIVSCDKSKSGVPCCWKRRLLQAVRHIVVM